MQIRKPAVWAALVALGGCSLQDDDICAALPSAEVRMQAGVAAVAPETNPSARVFAAMTVAEFCVQQTARKFAPSDDRADVVAKAVVGHCSEEISHVAAAQKAADRASNNTSPVMSSVTGRTTTLEARTFGEMEQFALARVVEARAGHCKPAR